MKKKVQSRKQGVTKSSGRKSVVDTLTHREVIDLGKARPAPLSIEAEKAIIQEKIQGGTNAAIALRYDVSEHVVSRVYNQFVKDVAKVKKSTGSQESALQFNNRIIHKARKAVEAGVDCNRDPYRRGSLGVKVLEGVGEFKSGTVINNNFAVVQATPAQFRDRYLGIQAPSNTNENKDGTNG